MTSDDAQPGGGVEAALFHMIVSEAVPDDEVWLVDIVEDELWVVGKIRNIAPADADAPRDARES